MGNQIRCAMALEEGVEGSLHLQGTIPWDDLDEDSFKLWSDDSGSSEVRIQVGKTLRQGMAP
jgi:hypothetical protein